MTVEKDVVGIDLGIRKTGVCWISGNRIVNLFVINTDGLFDELNRLVVANQIPSAVVVDAPINPLNGNGVRLVDRVFMRDMFNNNHVGLQPNNPDLLNMGNELNSLLEWCRSCDIHYSNDFPAHCNRFLRETMPNPSLGILSAPNSLLDLKQKLRFRYGRGANIAPITVAFEAHEAQATDFFAFIQDAPLNWQLLEQYRRAQPKLQADDLISALTCATLGWWELNRNDISFVRGDTGHYVLPPEHFINNEWINIINQILGNHEFDSVETNL